MAYPTGELCVDLHAIADNWKKMNSYTGAAAECGAVVKANAYGLGVERVAPKIYHVGCRHFFVANLKEGMQLRSLVGMDAQIYVLAGCIAGAERAFIDSNLIPVIVSVEMLNRWLRCCDGDTNARSVLKVNTGMGRMGLELKEFQVLVESPEVFERAGVFMLMSHFACADERDHQLNIIQQDRFRGLLSSLVSAGVNLKASIANSAGVFLGEACHYDLVRPGIALYGGNPTPWKENPMASVVGLRLPVIQTRSLEAGEYVGYGATKKFDTPRRIAVAAGGYADGIFRSLSNRGCGWLNGHKVPIVGRISMDSTIFDVTDVPGAESLEVGYSIELLGDHISIDELADAVGTVGYEVLTSFGSRYQRCYMG